MWSTSEIGASHDVFMLRKYISGQGDLLQPMTTVLKLAEQGMWQRCISYRSDGGMRRATILSQDLITFRLAPPHS